LIIFIRAGKRFRRSYIQSEEFQFVHQKKWVKAFRLSDNEPLFLATLIFLILIPDTKNVYPSGKGIDLVIQKLKEIIPQYVSLLGEQGKDWAYFFARAYLYPCGTGLSWHRDNQNHACGAFVYYAHPYWNPQWGAELLISSPQTATLEFPKRTLYEGGKKYLGSHLDNKFETDALMEEGMGHYILAKPNRLVLMGSGVLHCIKEWMLTQGIMSCNHSRIFSGSFRKTNVNKVGFLDCWQHHTSQ
jgi:hypothetical protein